MNLTNLLWEVSEGADLAVFYESLVVMAVQAARQTNTTNMAVDRLRYAIELLHEKPSQIQ